MESNVTNLEKTKNTAEAHKNYVNFYDVEILKPAAKRERVLMTPEKAQELLEKYEQDVNTKKALQRPPLSEKDYKKYAEAMLNDGWVYNGAPIIFDENDNLLDGRHRLKAIVESGKSVEVLVSRGVRHDVLHTIGQHRRRNFAQLLESRGVKNAAIVVRTLIKLFRIQNGTEMKWSPRPSNHRMNLILERNPVIYDGVALAQEFKDISRYVNAASLPVFTTMALIAGHEEKLREFLMDLRHANGDVEHPPYKLGLKVDTIKGMDGTITPNEGLAYAILHFNDFILGVSTRELHNWKPNYGTAETHKNTKMPKSRVSLISSAPPNCGLPEMIGYQGLRSALMSVDDLKSDTEFSGEIANTMMAGAKKKTQESTVYDVMITPELASYFLTFNTNNRKPQRPHYENLAKDMKRGYWMQNEQPIAFTSDPLSPDATPENCVLLNGQHRLLAIKYSDTSIESPIVTHIPAEAFPTYDNHAKRSTIAGVSDGDARVLHAAAKFQWMRDNDIPYQTSSTKFTSPTETDIKKTLETHANYMAALATTRKQIDNDSLEKLATTGIMAHVVFVARQNHPDVAEKFFDELRSGAGLEKGNPIIKLRSDLTALKSGGASRKKKLICLLRAWIDYLEWMEVDTSNIDLKENMLRDPKTKPPKQAELL